MLSEKFNWYRAAFLNLGLVSLVRLQVQKKFGPIGKLNKLTSKILRYPLYGRHGSSDFFIFNQIFVEKEYRNLDAIENVQLIIDCGANVGYSSAYFLSTHPDCFLIAIEPEEKNFNILEKNLFPYRGRYKAIRAAVWPHREKLRIRQTARFLGDEWSYSVEASSEEDSIHVQAVTVPDLIEQSKFQRVSILKIDIEGAEFNLFSCEAERWLNLVDNIVIELHGQECSEVFFKAIKGRGFNISTCGELTVCRGRMEVVD